MCNTGISVLQTEQITITSPSRFHRTLGEWNSILNDKYNKFASPYSRSQSFQDMDKGDERVDGRLIRSTHK